jgi:hypothetical protein
LHPNSARRQDEPYKPLDISEAVFMKFDNDIWNLYETIVFVNEFNHSIQICNVVIKVWFTPDIPVSLGPYSAQLHVRYMGHKSLQIRTNSTDTGFIRVRLYPDKTMLQQFLI